MPVPRSVAVLVVLIGGGLLAGCESVGIGTDSQTAISLPLPPQPPARLARAARRSAADAEIAAATAAATPGPAAEQDTTKAPETVAAAPAGEPVPVVAEALPAAPGTGADTTRPVEIAAAAPPLATSSVLRDPAPSGANRDASDPAGPAAAVPGPQAALVAPASPVQVRALGLSAATLRARFGHPAEERIAGPARVWRYPGRDCTTVLTLYYDLQRAAFVAVEQRQEGSAPSPEACLASRLAPRGAG